MSSCPYNYSKQTPLLLCFCGVTLLPPSVLLLNRYYCPLLRAPPPLPPPTHTHTATVMWSYTARAGHYGAYYAIKYVDPVWTSVSSVVNASESLVDSFVGLTSALPAVGGRKLSEYDPVTGEEATSPPPPLLVV